MEKRSSHYKVSRVQFALINRVVVYFHANCTLAAISLGRIFLGMLVFVIRLKLAPRPSFGAMWRLL